MSRFGQPRYAFGTVVSDDAWRDDLPEGLRSSAAPDGLWPGSYEMRAWVPRGEPSGRYDDVGADVFLFATTTDALRFFDIATATRCHRDGISTPASRPTGGRNLTWVSRSAGPS
jgi:hypothetical protein